MATALITGASRGLGRTLAEGLGRAGWSLVIDGRNAAALAQAEAALRPLLRPGASLVAIAGDVTDPAHRDALAAAVQGLGGLDVLVNNASTLGLSPLPALIDYPIDEVRRVLEVNTVAPLAVLQAVWPWLSRSPRPRLVNITSDAA
ncbi:MAG: SDR family oxidoreductase, partial [Acidimicrobiaceae bacterium]|nr:SDR family oxidoreductase [Acidimicrobiaceae bacterium]